MAVNSFRLRSATTVDDDGNDSAEAEDELNGVDEEEEEEDDDDDEVEDAENGDGGEGSGRGVLTFLVTTRFPSFFMPSAISRAVK